MSPEEADLYGGLAGAPLPCECFDFGHGIKLSRTYAHVMAPFLMAFGPPVNRLHPAPWRTAKGGLGFEILGQIHIPRDFRIDGWWDRLNIVWWFAALLRFRVCPYLTVPVVADGPFSDGPTAKGIRFIPIEIDPRLLYVDSAESPNIRETDLVWIRENWQEAAQLMRAGKGEFNLLFQACAECVFTRNPALALLSLWGALEGIFSPAKVELKFRISANIAAFLEGPGEERLQLQKQVAKLYDARSAAAHGGSGIPGTALTESYSLTKRVLTKMIETRHVPTKDGLDKLLFGA